MTLDAYASAKHLPVSFLQGLGLSDVSYLGAPAVRIPYRDEQGQEVAVQFRLSMEGGDRFRWKTGSKPLPYGLWRLNEAKAAGSIVLVEGANDSQTLWHHDLHALGIPGASAWRSEWDAYAEDNHIGNHTRVSVIRLFIPETSTSLFVVRVGENCRPRLTHYLTHNRTAASGTRRTD